MSDICEDLSEMRVPCLDLEEVFQKEICKTKDGKRETRMADSRGEETGQCGWSRVSNEQEERSLDERGKGRQGPHKEVEFNSKVIAFHWILSGSCTVCGLI